MTAQELIQALDLAPHPEGGWYRETFRSSAAEGERAAATAVYYVVETGQRSPNGIVSMRTRCGCGTAAIPSIW